MENTHSFLATITADVFINDDDFYFIKNCFESHYDLNVKMAAELGGWLYGFSVRRTPFKGLYITNDQRTVELSKKQIDLILKSLEMHNQKQSVLTRIRFSGIAKQLMETELKINKTLNNE